MGFASRPATSPARPPAMRLDNRIRAGKHELAWLAQQLARNKHMLEFEQEELKNMRLQKEYDKMRCFNGKVEAQQRLKQEAEDKEAEAARQAQQQGEKKRGGGGVLTYLAAIDAIAGDEEGDVGGGGRRGGGGGGGGAAGHILAAN